jgi:hypothetical protein
MARRELDLDHHHKRERKGYKNGSTLRETERAGSGTRKGGGLAVLGTARSGDDRVGAGRVDVEGRGWVGVAAAAVTCASTDHRSAGSCGAWTGDGTRVGWDAVTSAAAWVLAAGNVGGLSRGCWRQSQSDSRGSRGADGADGDGCGPRANCEERWS